MATNTGPLWKPEREPTRAQLRGETSEQHAARVIRETKLGYRGTKKRAWIKVRDNFLAEHVEHGGWYQCMTENGYGCGKLTQAPEVDHIIKRSVAPHLVLVKSNFQILCHDCHQRKDSGLKYKKDPPDQVGTSSKGIF